MIEDGLIVKIQELYKKIDEKPTTPDNIRKKKNLQEVLILIFKQAELEREIQQKVDLYESLATDLDKKIQVISKTFFLD